MALQYAGSQLGTVGVLTAATDPLGNTGSYLVEVTAPDGVVEGATLTGSATSGAALVTLNTAGYGYLEIQFTSVGSANTVAVECSSDGVAGTGSTFVPSPSTIGAPSASLVYYAPVTAPTMRVRVSAYTSGTVTVYVTPKRAAAPGQPVYPGTTLPTLVAGTRADHQLDSRGNLRTLLIGQLAAGADGQPNGAIIYATPATSQTAANPFQVVTNIFNGTTWDRLRTILGGIGAAGVGVTAVEMNGALFSNISTAATTTVKSGAGILHNITINTFVASATITIYNNTTAVAPKVATLTLPSTITALAPAVLNFDLEFSTGLTIVTSGAVDITVTYR